MCALPQGRGRRFRAKATGLEKVKRGLQVQGRCNTYLFTQVRMDVWHLDCKLFNAHVVDEALTNMHWQVTGVNTLEVDAPRYRIHS